MRASKTLSNAIEYVGEGPWRAAGRVAAALAIARGVHARGGCGILTYHRVIDVVPRLPKPEHNVTPSRFAEQLTDLVRRGFRAVSLTELLARAQDGKPAGERTFVITFDDGYESVYRHAWPVLRDLQLPATVFVSTAFLDSDEPFPCDDWGLAHRDRVPCEAYRPLTREQCQELLDSGLIVLGAHTHTHQDFRGNPGDFRRDLELSVSVLERDFGIQQPPFAFPFGCPFSGFAGKDLVAAAKQTPVTCGLTTESAIVDPRSDPFSWGRFNAFPWDTGATLAGKISGWYDWMPRLLRRCRQQWSAAGNLLTPVQPRRASASPVGGRE